MSQMGRYFVGIETMTGDVGGPIDPDNNGNLNLVGTAGLVDVTGFPLINTLIIDLDDSVANQYDCDVGTAVPVAHILNVNGVHGINTLGFLDTISIAINNTITLGDLAPVVGDSLTLTTGNETISAGNLNVTAGNINLPVSNAAGTEGFINVATIPFMSNLGTDNTFLGLNSGGLVLTTALENTGIGRSALLSLTTGNNNTTVGGYAGDVITTGSQNVAVGVDALGNITTGSYNTAIGYNSGSALTINDNSNILVNNIGAAGDSNLIRIGVSGGGAGQQNNCYIAGINGVNVGSVTRVVSCSGDHLGTTVITAGSNITVTGGANTITIASSGLGISNYTNVAVTPYVSVATDNYLSVDTSALAITIRLPDAATSGRSYTIKDRIGDAATRNITVTTVTGAVLIDGAATFVMNTAYESINIIGNGATFEIY